MRKPAAYGLVVSGLIVVASAWGQEPAESPGGSVLPSFAAGEVPSRLEYIDELLRAAWEEAGIKPSPICTDAEFLRRAYLDLLGRIPNVEEARAFLGGGKERDPGRRAKLIENLLAHPDYAKNMATIFANTLVGRRPRGDQVDREALVGWLRTQFATNRSWKDVAWDLLTATGSNREQGAVNFALAHFADEKVNLTAATTRVFLGLQIQCTQCHDHPSNDWKQQDFWGINAFFRGTRSRPVEVIDASGAVVRNGTEVYDEPTDAWARFEKRNAVVGVVPPTYLDGRRIDPGPEVVRRVELAKLITEPTNDQFAKAFVNRIWGHLLGRGIVHPVDDFGDHNPPSHPELIERLAVDFRASGYDVKALIRWITASEAYHVSSRMTKSNEKDDVLFSHYPLKPMSPEQLFDSLITATAAHRTAGGDSERRRSEWLRQFVVTFDNDEAGETSSFQGTIPQALMMMNGELMAKAVSGEPGSFLAHVLDESRLQRRVPPVRYAVEMLYLASLSRLPTPQELRWASNLFATNPDTLAVLQDLFWALLNSNEFVLNK
ncbi:MAG: hypothetical protein KatS3mg108_3122 [Isosphaeraceae bacterium]|jgi:hypothetical protein|nr:MAG: hypothetical protein KatS3mg108_3122 [Isosphaeraceae bacterium]